MRPALPKRSISESQAQIQTSISILRGTGFPIQVNRHRSVIHVLAVDKVIANCWPLSDTWDCRIPGFPRGLQSGIQTFAILLLTSPKAAAVRRSLSYHDSNSPAG